LFGLTYLQVDDLKLSVWLYMCAAVDQDARERADDGAQ
jgi:hypothetical protein